MAAGVTVRAVVASLAVALTAILLLSYAPPALAAPPANDDFENRELLGGGFPVEVSRSNVEATKEEGEFIPGLAPAGRSVWFEWEATSSDWVTIGACDSAFETIVAVFTGSELAHLTPAASGNADEGPDCPFREQQFTFKATSGVSYVIAVDGNIFHLPEAPTPVTEGEIVLRIEETPPPPNDDFANSTALDAPVEVEPGGDRRYFATVGGYNWKATTEVGEPYYGANAGASVWYSWTPPEGGKYRFNGPCCAPGFNWALFKGDSVGELVQLLTVTGFAEATVVADATYHIAVWGSPDLEAEEPTMGNFFFSIVAELSPLPPPDPGGGDLAVATVSPPPDTTPPETKIFKRRLRRRPWVWLFRFRSSERGSTFRCKLDRRPYRRCRSTKRLRRLRRGRHVLRVFAVDSAGNRDRTPAVARFRVPGKRKHRKGA